MPYKHLTLEERYAISHLLLIECSYREIGRRLGRSHTTIKREVKRNGEKYSRYWYTYTHQTALERRKLAPHSISKCTTGFSEDFVRCSII